MCASRCVDFLSVRTPICASAVLPEFRARAAKIMRHVLRDTFALRLFCGANCERETRFAFYVVKRCFRDLRPANTTGQDVSEYAFLPLTCALRLAQHIVC